MVQLVKNPTISMKMWVQRLALLSGLRIWHCHKLWLGHRCSSDLVLLWLWCRPAAALIQPLAQELPYAISAAMKREKKKKKNVIAKKSWPSSKPSVNHIFISTSKITDHSSS